jgi:thiol-disulfide isomerase/thioredoxin
MKVKVEIAVAAILLFAGAVLGDETQNKEAPKTINEVYPGLASGALTYAVIGELPEGILLRSEGIAINSAAVDAEIAKAPEQVRKQLVNNRFFILEGIATERLLFAIASQGTPLKTESVQNQDQRDAVIKDFLGKQLQGLDVSEDETKKFYEENKDLCGGAPLDQVREAIKGTLLEQKQQDAVAGYIRTIGKKIPVEVSVSWVKQQAVLAMDNPVDKARASGKPSVVDFGADGCRPCDMMTPVLAALKTKFEGKVNVLFVHVRNEPVLGARYGIQTIPVQVFFDEKGKEVFRHTGFFPQDQIEKKLAEMGVK